jgi:hypothetical protein
MDLSTARSILLRANEDSEVLDSEDLDLGDLNSENTLQLFVEAKEEPGVRDIEDEANRLIVEHNEPAFLPPGYQLENDSDPDDTDAEYNDTLDFSDEETFDLMVGNMRRGYEEDEQEDEEEEEEEEVDEKDEEEDQAEEHSTTDLSTHPGQGLNHEQSALFDYREPIGDSLTAKEILSLAMHCNAGRYITRTQQIDR